ncbi:hypothetical protein J5N97_017180 [Dioscorea zingiberensis]|uniref:WRKY19-like zinc finger domain-containing protein n=1 Tax=Dioscorea zingiberensis TaxID=325984 RepID=A0A9D5CLA3_9LILI|nr:hypothetical protein J5N97_017180 [Dioscorea zingiberensis]
MTDLFFHGKCSVTNSSVTETGKISFSGNGSNLGDTALRLDYVGYGVEKNAKVVYPRSNNCDFPSAQDDGCRLVLGLGPTPTYHNDYRSTVFSKTKESTSLFNQSVISESDSGLLKLGLSRDISEPIPDVSQVDLDPSHLEPQSGTNEKSLFQVVVDEGSTSAKKSGGYMPSLIFAPRLENFSSSHVLPEPKCNPDLGIDDDHGYEHQHARDQLKYSPEPSSMSELSDSMITDVITNQRTYKNQPRKCRFKGCSKGARGSSGLCIAHGGGQRCQKPGCNKGAESRTAYCKAHGGGRRCQTLGCTKSAEGKTDYCIAHGGGRRCGHPECTKAARGKSGLCIRHGGGKRCTVDGCARSAEGQAGLCISHGGGRRCQYQGCGKGAQGSTMYCKAHGGGKRCIFEGPRRGKRCTYPGGCEKFARGKSGLCAAHGSIMALQQEHKGVKNCGMIGPSLFKGIVLTSMNANSNVDNEGHSSSGASASASAISECNESSDNAVEKQQLIPHQLLVPISMKLREKERSTEFVIPEGRVHGGGLMYLFGGNLKNAVDAAGLR